MVKVLRAIRLRASAAAVQHGKILLVPHHYMDGSVRWYLPGGKVEWLEPLETAAIREFREETGFDIALLSLLTVAESLRPGEPWHSVTVVFSARIIGGELRPEASRYAAYGDKAPKWFGPDELPEVVEYLVPSVRKALHWSASNSKRERVT